MQRHALAGLVVASLLLGIAFPAAAAGFPSVFNTIEFRADAQLALPQWMAVQERIKAERAGYEACAEAATACGSRAAAGWQSLLTSLRGADRQTQVRAVNQFANRVPYRSDEEVWQKRDFWATPIEFMRRSGDCEDYAILKYVSLRQLGVPVDEMRIAVVQDVVRDLAHAVLLVQLDGRLVVLDNLTNAILPQERTAQYVPYYTVNEEARYAHLAPDGKTLAAAAGRPARR